MGFLCIWFHQVGIFKKKISMYFRSPWLGNLVENVTGWRKFVACIYSVLQCIQLHVYMLCLNRQLLEQFYILNDKNIKYYEH